MRWVTLGLFIALPAAAQNAGWVPLSAGWPAVAVDTSTSVLLGPRHGIAVFRIRYAGLMPTPTRVHRPPHRETQMLAEVRCADSSFRTLMMRFFDDAGREIVRVRETSPWMRHDAPATGFLMVAGWCKLHP